jgi:pimeloyl-ACP methyl ester carboxylesterase
MILGTTLLAIFGAAVATLLAIALYFVSATRRIARMARRLVPPPGKFVEIDGNRIHYVDRGEGPPILFLHGLGGTQFQFLPLFPRLEKDFRLVAVDRPGSGYSTRRGLTPASPKEQAEFVARFIDAVGLDRPLLVGHSLGGAVALATALDFSEKISGLALISPLTQREDEVAPEFALLDISSPLKRRLIAHTVAVPNAIKFGPQTLAYVFGPQEPPADYAVAGGAMSALTPEHFFASSTDLVTVEEVMGEQQERYGELDLPVGIIFGTADRVIDWEWHGKGVVGKIRDVDFEWLEGIGHMPQYAATDRVEAFIRRVAERAFRIAERLPPGRTHARMTADRTAGSTYG